MKFGLMDEPAFNIKFVEIVKKYPCLYDFTRPEYSKREQSDHAWTIVSSEMKMTVPQCKEKWRNLRTALARSMKLKKNTPTETTTTNSDTTKSSKKNKEYYLKEAMHFILPFLRSRGAGENITVLDTTGSEVPYDHTHSNESGEFRYDHHAPDPNHFDQHHLDSNQYVPNRYLSHYGDCSPAGYSSYSSSSVDNPRKRTYEASQNENYPDAYEPARLATRAESEEASKLLGDCFEFMTTSHAQDNNPDLQFLKSLLPDISKMSDPQKRQFKKRILEVIDSILGESSLQSIGSK